MRSENAALLVRWKKSEAEVEHLSTVISYNLTSNGTVAERRGEGHHFIAGGVKQACDKFIMTSKEKLYE